MYENDLTPIIEETLTMPFSEKAIVVKMHTYLQVKRCKGTQS